ncbi:MAG: sulfatase-like hydrolase/transferase [Candidatus Hydrogenedentes bacterium]|nr:sulfatase-like hydrolase/transferase [Candidatus Hydrogenedentota bacterium]
MVFSFLPGLFCASAGEVRPNVLIITLDTTRVDRIRCYGYPLARTSGIDRLAAEGVRCADAATVAPITLPAHASILTGLFPPAHGVRDNGAYALSDSAVTLAERFKAAGYDTAAFVSALVLSKLYNLTQGFDVYDDDLWPEDEPEMFMIRDRPGPKTAKLFTEWLEQWHGRGAGPFFAWVHMFDPHQPFNSNPPDAYLCPTAYDAEIAQADDGVEIILKWLEGNGVLDQTLIVLTADHGESLGEHKEKTHAIFIYDATIRVPLVWRYPGVLPAGKVYEGAVRAVDIAPTVLAAAGIAGGDQTQGENLLGALRGDVAAPELPQYCESLLSQVGFGMAPLYGVRLGGFKYIRAPRPELYDLKNDPKELANLYEQRKDFAVELDGRLDAVIKQSEALALDSSSKKPMDGETMEMLEALGYMASEESISSMGGMDPKDGIEIYEMLENARGAARFGRWDICESLCRKLLERVPGHASALNMLASALMRGGRLDEAEGAYVKSLESEPRQHRVHLMMANISIRRGNLDEGEARIKKVFELSPKFPEAMIRMGYIERLRGNRQGAEEWIQKAAAEDPKSPRVQASYAELFYLDGNYGEALEHYRKSLEVNPKNFSAIMLAGGCAQKEKLFEDAERYYQQGLKLRGDSWLPPYNLGCLRAVQERKDEAFGFLKQAVGTNTGRRQLRSLLGRDKDLDGLRGDGRFAGLVAAVNQQGSFEERVD